jgi:molybdate transport system substrate-binding protein
MRGTGAVLAMAGLLGVFPGLHPAQAADRVVSVAAAADLKFAMDDLVASFERSHPDIFVRSSFGSSGNFFSALQNEAPFDLFLSADVEYARRLKGAGLSGPGSVFLYALGRLVLFVPRSFPEKVTGLAILESDQVKHVAIANPEHAPYGRAAEAALRKAGLYERVKSKLVFGENVAQTAQFVETGAADAGLIALSLALAPGLQKAGRYVEIPRDTYPPIEQGGLVLKWAKDRAAAEAFRDFVLGAEGRAILLRYGFLPPGD